ncbi:beta-mannosidase [Paenibacillus koleovorans]|uniref:beta-mannosidase n=1 Tax=Paenibacillus koleovorans TaxID=121608 RepID=UPI000FD712B8|nr:glycoside hydrolase family 2 protein [Paenibacillus koleovorans]
MENSNWIKLNEGWSIRSLETAEELAPAVHRPDYKGEGWLTAAVPGDVHTSLLAHGVIPDPYYSTNDHACRWVEAKDWVYRQVFDAPVQEPAGGRVFLDFQGLDTLAAIYLNGTELARTDNMFVPLSLDVTGRLRETDNVLVVRFESVVEAAKQKDVSKFWSKINYERIWFRKCAAHYSWDWSPRLVTTGIWREVGLRIVDSASLRHVFFRTLSLEADGSATVAIDAEVDRSPGSTAELAMSYKLSRGGREYRFEAAVGEDGQASVQFRVEQAELWWTNDQGTPSLYELDTQLLANGRIVDERRQEVGIRTIAVKQRSEDGKPRFTFVLNGREIYAKGGNWIPAHNLPGSLTSERYVDLIELSRQANMNMLRVWGGGIYEEDIFYQECSRQGILVWQDFMFSCSEFPDYDRDFMANVAREVEHNVKALRSYPCIAIWCGNNENQAIHSEKMYYRSDYRFYGEKIFHELMPSILERLDTTRLYWPSSPWGGNDPNSFDEGDQHNWAVWAGDVYPRHYGEASNMNVSAYGISYRRYAEDTSKFSSEFGIHGSTVKETLRRSIPESELYLGSFELDYRNKDYEPEKATITMAAYSGLPSDLDEYIDFSMLCQAEGLKFGVEHFRRRKPENSGALIWQLNDCWPGISWSLIDYYLFPKASYYYARRFFSPILLSFQESGGRITVWVTNDTDTRFSDTIVLEVTDCFGNTAYEERILADVAPNHSKQIASYEAAETEWRFGVINRRDRFIRIGSSYPEVYDNYFFFAEQKDLRFSPCRLQSTCTPTADGFEIELSTDRFARFVKLECPIDHTLFSDNYFNMRPGERKKVRVTNRKGSPVKPADIRISALNGVKP